MLSFGNTGVEQIRRASAAKFALTERSLRATFNELPHGEGRKNKRRFMREDELISNVLTRISTSNPEMDVTDESVRWVFNVLVDNHVFVLIEADEQVTEGPDWDSKEGVLLF